MYSTAAGRVVLSADWRKSKKGAAPTRDRTEDLVVNSHSLYQRSSGGNQVETGRY